MKKIFFVFAMMFLPFISAMAEESSELSETFYLDDALDEETCYTCTGSYFIVEGDAWSYFYGMYLNDGNKITVRSKTGEKITRVECVTSNGGDLGYTMNVDPASASVTVSKIKDLVTYIISNVNATSLVISSDAISNDEEDDVFAIDELVVYYEPQGNGGEEENTSISEEYIQFESFATTNGTEYLGNNVQVTGTEANANGLSIGNGKTVTISPYNDNDVRILKVELEFENEFNGTINGLDGCVIEGSGTSKTISNFYSPTITISSPNGSGQIKNITIYYVKMSEEKHVTIATNTGKDYIEGEGHIKVSGTESVLGYGLDIDNGESVTITSVKGAEISKVDLQFGYYDASDSIRSTAGTRVIRDVDPEYPYQYWTINGVNSSSLTISHPVEDNRKIVRLSQIKVYYKEPVPNSTMEVAANKAGDYYWTTFYSNASNYQAPEGTQVFKVNLEGSKVTMIPIEDRIVNRYEGVVLKSETDNIITMTKTDDNSFDSYAGNSLKGTAYKITNPGNAYVLNYRKSGGVAFYKLSDNGTIAANKAYLKANSNASAHEFFTFDFDTTATGVDSINTQDSEEDADVKIYDLQGRRVANPGKGIYIVNGKKVLMK